MKNVLFIAYYFPPLGMSGIQRTLKFVKYLPEFDWHPLILTIRQTVYYAKDFSLFKEIPNSAEVYRTFSLEPLSLWSYLKSFLGGQKGLSVQSFATTRQRFKVFNDWLFIPDNKTGWLPFAFWSGLKLIKKGEIDVIYSTAPPYTSHLIGYLLKKCSGKPLVLDFRDLWTQRPLLSYPTLFHQRANEFLERKILQEADQIITISELWKRNWILKYSFLPEQKFTVISHGFDSEDFIGVIPHRTEVFTVTHAGALIEITAKYFFLALKSLLEEYPEFKNKMAVKFIGVAKREEQEIVREFGLENTVRFIPYLPHQQCLQAEADSDVLLLLTMEEEEMRIRGKLYEYLGTGKSILAITPEGETANLIKELKVGKVVSPKDISGIKEAILSYYHQYANGFLPTFKPAIKRFDRKNLTLHLAEVFNEVSGETSLN
ncbi:MAG: glycosyltransferase [Candidatus Edwardsbacteria bacterium]